MKRRQAARVVLVNSAGEVFLIQAKDLGCDAHRWWMTCGGGAELGETAAQTAARELAEETGVECSPQELIGPLAVRRAVFEFSEKTLHQDEVFFGFKFDDEVDLDGALWTEIEKASIVSCRWWSAEELQHTSETFYPRQLPELLAMVQSGTVPASPPMID